LKCGYTIRKMPFFSFKTIYNMSCHLLTKLELKAKTSVAQTGSQPFVYAKGLKGTKALPQTHVLKYTQEFFSSSVSRL
jgi:hypothetical protein